jgi:hypothetical protein
MGGRLGATLVPRDERFERRYAFQSREAHIRALRVHATGHELCAHAGGAHLIEFVDRDQRFAVQPGGDAGGLEHGCEQRTMVQLDREIAKPRAVRTSLTADSCSASTTGDVDPIESMSHW